MLNNTILLFKAIYIGNLETILTSINNYSNAFIGLIVSLPYKLHSKYYIQEYAIYLPNYVIRPLLFDLTEILNLQAQQYSGINLFYYKV